MNKIDLQMLVYVSIGLGCFVTALALLTGEILESPFFDYPLWVKVAILTLWSCFAIGVYFTYWATRQVHYHCLGGLKHQEKKVKTD